MIVAGKRAGVDTGTGCVVAGGGERELVATVVATFGDADVCRGDFDGYVHEYIDSLGYFPFLGFTGDRAGWIRGREKRGENLDNPREEPTLTRFGDDLRF